MMVNSKIINDMLIDLNLIHLSVSLVTLPFLILTIIFLFDSEFYFGISCVNKACAIWTAGEIGLVANHEIKLTETILN